MQVSSRCPVQRMSFIQSWAGNNNELDIEACATVGVAGFCRHYNRRLFVPLSDLALFELRLRYCRSRVQILTCSLHTLRWLPTISGPPTDRRGSGSPRHERAKSSGLNPRSRQNSWQHQHYNPPSAPPSPTSGLKHQGDSSGFPFIAVGGIASDRQARRTSAAASLPSAAAAVATAGVSTSVPSSPTFSQQQRQQQQQQRRHQHEGQYQGRGSCPTVFPSSSTGATAGRESANTSRLGGQREAGDFNDGDTGCVARGLEGRSNIFGTRHRQGHWDDFRMFEGRQIGSIRRVNCGVKYFGLGSGSTDQGKRVRQRKRSRAVTLPLLTPV